MLYLSFSIFSQLQPFLKIATALGIRNTSINSFPSQCMKKKPAKDVLTNTSLSMWLMHCLLIRNIHDIKLYSWLCTAYKMHSEKLCGRQRSYVNVVVLNPSLAQLEKSAPSVSLATLGIFFLLFFISVWYFGELGVFLGGLFFWSLCFFVGLFCLFVCFCSDGFFCLYFLYKCSGVKKCSEWIHTSLQQKCGNYKRKKNCSVSDIIYLSNWVFFPLYTLWPLSDHSTSSQCKLGKLMKQLLLKQVRHPLVFMEKRYHLQKHLAQVRKQSRF